MKLLSFYLNAKEHTSEYRTLEEYVRRSVHSRLCDVEEILKANYIVELHIEYSEKDSPDTHVMMFSSYSTETLMDYIKENYKELYDDLPLLNCDVFDMLAKMAKASTHLSLKTVKPDEDLEFEFGDDPEVDDFIPERITVEESFDEIRINGFYTRLQCYPETPIGFWTYVGLDFTSLFNQVAHLD